MIFTSPSSTGVEGDVLTTCLAVVRGGITTPTNITLTTAIGEQEEGGYLQSHSKHQNCLLRAMGLCA